MDFNSWVSKSLNTFKKDVYRCHCFVKDGQRSMVENTITLKGFKDSTVEQCLSNLVFEQYDTNHYDFNIVTDIVNKLVILTIKGKYYLREVTIDKIERIQDIED